MGKIVGAAVVSHHPGLVQPKEIRVQRGNGRDSDLIEGFDRVRARVDALKPDTFVIFDTHWITTSMHLVAGAAHYKGTYMSDELPYSMPGFPYDYRGAPELAGLVEEVAQEKKVPARNVTAPELPLHYPTINVVHLLGRGEKVLSVGSCQAAKFKHFLQMGEVVAEAVEALRCAGRAAGLGRDEPQVLRSRSHAAQSRGLASRQRVGSQEPRARPGSTGAVEGGAARHRARPLPRARRPRSTRATARTTRR